MTSSADRLRHHLNPLHIYCWLGDLVGRRKAQPIALALEKIFKKGGLMPNHTTIWDFVQPEFSRAEKWGDPSKMSGLLLILLKIIRRETGWPIAIHCGWEEDGHVSDSQHQRGSAADFHFIVAVPYKVQVDTLSDLLVRLQAAEFVGLGIYPDWNTPGFHLDTRGVKARWGRVAGKYVSFAEAYRFCAAV